MCKLDIQTLRGSKRCQLGRGIVLELDRNRKLLTGRHNILGCRYSACDRRQNVDFGEEDLGFVNEYPELDIIWDDVCTRWDDHTHGVAYGFVVGGHCRLAIHTRQNAA